MNSIPQFRLVCVFIFILLLLSGKTITDFITDLIYLFLVFTDVDDKIE